MASPATASATGNTPQPSKGRYRPEIDGLRAFAVVAVIINHFNKDLLPSGYLGVDIFFVISGYVITSSLAGRESKNFLDFLTGFYERRIKRLVPALVVFVLITSVLISLFNPDPGVALGLGWRSLFGISNINLYQGSTDYFAESTELNPFTHTWSLGVEEQFYLLFPFLIWFSGFGQQATKGAKNLFFWVGALTIASLIGFIYLYKVNQPAAYFLMPPRFWEMAAGCLIFIGFQKRARIEQALEQVPPLLVVAAMVGVMFLPVSAAVPATISVVVLSAILIACLKKGTAAYQFFTREKVVFIGLISYSLYLWHWTVLSISRWTIGIHWWSIPIQVGLMILMAAGSHRWIESPTRKQKFNKRYIALALGLGSVLVSGLFGRVINQFQSRIYLGNGNDSEDGGKAKISNYLNKDIKPIDNLGGRCLSGHPPFKDALLGAKSLTTDFKRNCLWLGADKEKPFVAIIGDSHAASLYSSARKLHQEGFTVFFHARPSCIYPYPEETVLGCKEVMNSTTEFLISKFREEGGGVIVIKNYYQGHFSEDGHMKGQFRDQNGDAILDKFSNAVGKLSERISRVNGSIIVIAPIPDHSFYVQKHDPIYPKCNPQWFSALNSSCPGDQNGTSKISIKTEMAPYSLAIQKIASKHLNVLPLDIFDLLCGSTKKCNIFRENMPLYTDSDHLSNYANSIIYPRLRGAIDSASRRSKNRTATRASPKKQSNEY